MNVKNPLFPPPSNKKGHTPRTPTPTSTHTRANTPTPTPDLSGPSQHYWTMSQYLEISLPLTMAVILLPLIAGPCFRYMSQQYEIHRRHWRALFVVLAACYFISLIVMFYLRLISDIWVFVYLLTSYSVLGTVCMVRVVRAYRGKQGRLRRSLQLLALLIFLTADLFISTLPWANVSFLFMFLTSQTGIRWLKGRWTWFSWKTKRQSVAGYTTV